MPAFSRGITRGLFAPFLLLVLPGLARAADFTWSGAAPSSQSHWSVGGNWSGAIAPANGATIGTLTFPALPAGACAETPPTPPASTCGFGVNDLTGLSVGTLAINDANTENGGQVYAMSGNGITLTGGLSASPGTILSNGPFESNFTLPITLGATQTWTIAPNPTPPSLGQITYPYGLSIGGPVTGPADGLSIQIGSGATLALSGDDEVGPVSVTGLPSALTGFGPNLAVQAFNGGSAALNATDGQPITITDAQLNAFGRLGPVQMTASQLFAGSSIPPAAALNVSSMELDGASTAYFHVVGSGSTAGSDYSQITASGPITLGGARLGALIGSDLFGAVCPSPPMGTVYTIVSTAGSLTGTFDVPEGTDLIPSGLAPTCPETPSLFALRIDYHETGSPQTVTATVVPAPPPGVRPGLAGASPVSGVVAVRMPRTGRFIRLKPGELVPTGAELDTTQGTVRLFVASTQRGGIQSAVLYSGRFIFRQTGRVHPRTTFVLSQPLTGCTRAGPPPGRATAARGRRRRPTTRQVWVTEKNGNFNTKGQYVGTSVQGTIWLTADTCTSSTVRVKQGVVVVHDFIHHRTIKLRAGQSYTARTTS